MPPLPAEESKTGRYGSRKVIVVLVYRFEERREERIETVGPGGQIFVHGWRRGVLRPKTPAPMMTESGAWYGGGGLGYSGGDGNMLEGGDAWLMGLRVYANYIGDRVVGELKHHRSHST